VEELDVSFQKILNRFLEVVHTPCCEQLDPLTLVERKEIHT